MNLKRKRQSKELVTKITFFNKKKKLKKNTRNKEQVNLKMWGSLLENECNLLKMVLFSPPPILRFLPWNGQLCAGCEKGL